MEATKNGGTPKTEFPILFYYFAVKYRLLEKYDKKERKKRMI